MMHDALSGDTPRAGQTFAYTRSGIVDDGEWITVVPLTAYDRAVFGLLGLDRLEVVRLVGGVGGEPGVALVVCGIIVLIFLFDGQPGSRGGGDGCEAG